MAGFIWTCFRAKYFVDVTDTGVNVNGKHEIPWGSIREIEAEEVDARRLKISITYATEFMALPTRVSLSTQIARSRDLASDLQKGTELLGRADESD